MKKCVRSLFVFLLIVSVVSCNVSSSTSTVSPSNQPVTVTFTSPASTAVFVPTLDPRTPTAIAEFFKTLEANKTPVPEVTQIPGYVDCSGNLFFMSIEPWALCHGLQDPITVVSQSGQSWQFSYENYYGMQVHNPCTRLLHLSADERYLYFSLDAECQLVEPGLVVSIAVFRMNLLEGNVIEVLRGDYDFASDNGYYYTASISPTGRRLAYIFEKDQPLKLQVLDLQTGETDSFVLEEKYIFGGNYRWSADGTKLIFMLESEDNYEHFISISYIDLLNADSLVTFITGKDFRWIMANMEVNDTGVTISMQDEAPLFYDVNTGTLSTIIQ